MANVNDERMCVDGHRGSVSYMRPLDGETSQMPTEPSPEIKLSTAQILGLLATVMVLIAFTSVSVGACNYIGHMAACR